MADFKQAIKWMKEGKKVRRKDMIFYFEDATPYYTKIEDYENNNDCSNHPPCMNDYEATDWEIYEELTTSRESTFEGNANDIAINDHCEHNDIQFHTLGCDNILELKENGDIFVKGKLIENDKEVVDAMRKLLRFEKVKVESLSDEIWTQEERPIYRDLPDMIPVSKIKKAVVKLKIRLHLSWNDAEIINEIFGPKLA